MSEALERNFNPAVVANLAAEEPRRQILARTVPPIFVTLKYGDSPRRRIDLYRPVKPNGSLLLYFHGGYWISGEPSQSAFVAGPFLAAGTTVAIAGYDLCPEVSLATIVDQAREIRNLLLTRATELEIDTAQILLCGSSAGAYLCAMLLQDGPAAWPFPPAASLVTGVFDLKPVLGISINDKLGLRTADVEPLSPLRRAMSITCRSLLVAVGAEEPEPWRMISLAFAEKAKREGIPTQFLVCRSENHFSLTTALGQREHVLARKTLGLLGS